jgi:hypothetical protein
MAYHGEVAECALPSGVVLVAAWLDVPDHHPAETQYEVIRPGGWLCYSTTYESLGGDTERGIAQFYQEAP